MLDNIKVDTEFGLGLYGLDELEQYKSITTNEFKALKYNDNTEEQETIGNAVVYTIDTWLGDDYIFDIADDISQDFINTLESVSEEVDIEDISKVVYIDRIEIDEKYRNNGYGTKLLEFISSYYEDMGAILLMLCASPLCDSKDEVEVEKYKKKYKKKLYKFYKNQEFQQIDNEKDTYFYKVIGY